MDLDAEARSLLARARIGMLALNSRRLPLVTPAAFHFASSTVWMTTSRHAVKVALARRDPRAAFLVEDPESGVLLQGALDVLDPRSLQGPVRAALEGPRFALGLGGYVLKNAPFVAGYLLDLAATPRNWWPQNRVILRMRASRARKLPALKVPSPAPLHIPGLGIASARTLGRSPLGRLCWSITGGPQLAAAAWTLEGSDALVWLPEGAGRGPREGAGGALLVERHHPFRATRMLGACLRGELCHEPAAAEVIAERYAEPLYKDGRAFRLVTQRVTWWRGFEVHTVPTGAPGASS